MKARAGEHFLWHTAAAVLLLSAPMVNADPPDRSVDWSRIQDLPDQRMTITWLGTPSFSGGREGAYIEQRLEEKYNVEFEPIFLDAHAYATKKGLMFAGGKVPDVCFDAQVRADAHHGFLLELPYPLLLKHAPHYVAALNRAAPNAWLLTHYDGRNYGLPTVYLNGIHPGPGIWRKDWLQAVGLNKIPETLNEMFEALRRITFDDPDKNGRDDTYGMSGDVQDFWWTSFSEIFGAFGVLPYDWMLRDGKIVWGGLLPETRSALGLLRKWYEAGVIDPEFVTDRQHGSVGLTSKFANGRIGYLYYEGRYTTLDTNLPASLASRTITLNPNAELAPARFPMGPQGHAGGRVWGPDGAAVVFGSHLDEHPRKVLRVLRMLDDMMADEAFHIETKAGQRGLHWDYIDSAAGPESGLRLLPPYDEGYRARREILSPNLSMQSFWNPTSSTMETWEKYTPRPQLQFRRQHRNIKWAMQDALGKPDYVPSAQYYMGDLRMMQLTWFAEIIRGDRELESFDAFVSAWLARGGTRLTREANELLHLKQSIFSALGISDPNAK